MWLGGESRARFLKICRQHSTAKGVTDHAVDPGGPPVTSDGER
jgi:hypothetical protein